MARIPHSYPMAALLALCISVAALPGAPAGGQPADDDVGAVSTGWGSREPSLAGMGTFRLPGADRNRLRPTSSLSTTPPAGVPFSQMVVIAWDGAQMARTLELVHSGALPNLAQLVQEGSLVPTWVTTHNTATIAGFAEIITGYPPQVTGVYNQFALREMPRDFSIFYRLKRHLKGNITIVCASGKGWRVGSLEGQPWHQFRPDIDVWYGDDFRLLPRIGRFAVKSLETYAKPGANYFCFFHFKEPDPEGHAHGAWSPEYAADLVELDVWLGRIRQRLDDAGVGSTTAVCVLTDHGMEHDRKGHRYAPDAWLATNWAELLEGDQRDVAPTILAAFGIDPGQFSPPLLGHPLWEPAPPVPSVLFWLPSPGYADDGVDPDLGQAWETRFAFKVLCADAERHAPRYVSLHLRRNGKLFQKLAMVRGVGDYRTGRVYRLSRKLPPGEYQHRFRARDRNGLAIGEATQWTAGPTVRREIIFPPLISLSAVPTNAGTQITFSLSSAAQVQARIVNIAGRPVETLCHAKDCEAGTNRLLWNAQSEGGLPVPSGTYLVEATVKTPDGAQARALAQVRIDR